MSDPAGARALMIRMPMVHSIPALTRLFELIANARVPRKIDLSYLTGLGFVQSNDTDLLRLLRLLGVVGRDGGPTDQWRAYRHGSEMKRQEILGSAIRSAYLPLFQSLSDAHLRATEDLDRVLRKAIDRRTSRERTIRTFIRLCELAGIRDRQPEPTVTSESMGDPYCPVVLGLPANASFEVYLEIFTAMRKVFMRTSTTKGQKRCKNHRGFQTPKTVKL